MPLLPFVVRPDRAGESICMKCFRTVRTDGAQTMDEAQAEHRCSPIDLTAVYDPPSSD